MKPQVYHVDASTPQPFRWGILPVLFSRRRIFQLTRRLKAQNAEKRYRPTSQVIRKLLFCCTATTADVRIG